MTEALYSGVSGMLAHQLRLDAVGNNIANADTVGYKSERALFTDALYEVVDPGTAPSGSVGGSDPSALGQGVRVAGLETNFAQGTMQASGRTTDVAVEGQGFLAVTDGSRIFYTRNGALNLDSKGNLIHAASGLKVVALPAGSTGSAVTPASTIQVPLGQTSVARATTEMTVGGNLDSRLATGQQYQMSAQVFDSLGAAHSILLDFTKNAAAGTWDVSGTSADGAITFTGGSQAVFDQNGAPTTPTLTMQLALTNPGGATGAIGASISLAGATQLAKESGAALISQNGLSPGTLTGININGDGSIMGVFSNGASNSVGQLVTAVFSNSGGLNSLGNSLFSAGLNSGQPVYSNPGSNGHGDLHSGELESSNVNLAQEFADMIVTQRGFQASARVVTTSDQMLQELMNVIR